MIVRGDFENGKLFATPRVRRSRGMRLVLFPLRNVDKSVVGERHGKNCAVRVLEIGFYQFIVYFRVFCI